MGAFLHSTRTSVHVQMFVLQDFISGRYRFVDLLFEGQACELIEM